MKNSILTVFLLLFVIGIKAQTAGGYTFNVDSATAYTSISGGTVLFTCPSFSSGDVSTSVTLPLPFTFEGIAYATIRVGFGGWITLGSNDPLATAPSFASSPFSTLANVPGVIAVCSKADYGPSYSNSVCVSEVSALASGNEFIIQWKNMYDPAYSTYGLSGINFQLRLQLNTGIIKMCYGGKTGGTGGGQTVKVGLRGNGLAFNTYVNNRTTDFTSVGWKRSTRGQFAGDACALQVIPTGLTYIYTPANCYTPINLKAVQAFGSSIRIKWNKSTSADGYEYAVQTSNFSLPATGTFVPDSFVNLSLNSSTIYYIYVRSKCGTSYTNWATLKFRTLCDPATLPYKETFSNTSVNVNGAHYILPCIGVDPEDLNSPNSNLQWQPDVLNNTGMIIDNASSSTVVNSWFFTKTFQLNAGTTYRIYFKYLPGGFYRSQDNNVKLQMATAPEIESLLPSPLLNVPLSRYQYGALDTLALFTPATSGLYCAGFYGSSNTALGTISIPEVDVLINPGPPPCTQNLSPLNNSTVSNCNTFRFIWNKIANAQFYNIYMTDSIYGYTDIVNFSPLTDTFYNYNFCSAPGNKFTWYVVPRSYGSDAAGCVANTSFFRVENPAAPPNDLCSNAQTLTVGKGFCSNQLTGSLINSTLSNPSDTVGICKPPYYGPPQYAPVYRGHDVWYKLVVPSTGNVLVQISQYNQNTYGTTTVMRAFSGSCGTLSPISCSYAGLENLPYSNYPPYTDRLKLTGRTPGETIFIRISSVSSEKYFTICSYDTTASQLPDIVSAINTCTSVVPVIIDSLAGNQFMWVPLLTADGKIIGEIHGHGSKFGTLSGGVYINSGSLRTSNGTKYLDRNLTLTPSAFSSDIYRKPSIRFFVKTTELNTYNTAAGSQSLNNFRILENSDPCSSTLVNQGTNLGFISDSGYYKGDRELIFITSGFSSFYFYKAPNNVVLPVSLLSFSVKKNSYDAQLNWQIANAINFSHFDVERSVDGSNFQKIISINYNSNSLYQFIDKKPGAGIFYYRLKIIDMDGRVKYSQIIVITFDYNNFSIQPNPVTSSFTINGAAQIKQLQFFDMNGRMVKEQKPSTGNVYNVAELPSGIYLLRIVTAESINNFKLIKQ